MECEPPYDVVTTSGVTIVSPNYPNFYDDNISCQLTLTFDVKVSIEFETFYTDSSDHLEVRDGDSSSSRLIGTVDGPDTPSPMESTGRSMTLVFSSNYNYGYSGFRIIANEGKN